MRHINKRWTAMILLVILVCVSCTGCDAGITYHDTDLSVYIKDTFNEQVLSVDGFAQDLCVSDSIWMPDGELAHAPEVAGLFDLTDSEVLYAKNIYDTVEPASITKLLTALVAFKYGNLDDIVTASENIVITESGAKLCGFQIGDQMTLRDVMYGLLVYSGNEAGIIIAEHISGSVEAFVELMNEEANRIGATATNFLNPHGLTAEGHVTTAYDLYLIFSELLQYPEFLEMIQTKSYTCIPNQLDSISEEAAGTEDTQTTEAAAGTEDTLMTEAALDEEAVSDTDASSDETVRKLVWNNTNWYFSGKATAPSGVTVIGGKTGTTAAAGSCLILLCEDEAGKQYIAVVMHAATKEDLYAQMNDLLEEIVN